MFANNFLKSIAVTISLAALPPVPSEIPSALSIYADNIFCPSIDSITPVERITGIKNIALNAALPAIFWLSITAMKSEKIRIIGISNIMF